jgi:hypothetical protein
MRGKGDGRITCKTFQMSSILIISSLITQCLRKNAINIYNIRDHIDDVHNITYHILRMSD